MSPTDKIPEITIHGRFQPVLHVNHWNNVVRPGFELADHVTILITNPCNNEQPSASAPWRHGMQSNPWTYDERVLMFRALFKALQIDPIRYDFRPFNIKDEASFDSLDRAVPCFVNIYSPWSEEKAKAFKAHGLPVITRHESRVGDISGTSIREIISKHDGSDKDLKRKLVVAGFMPKAVPGLLTILRNQRNY